MNILFFTPGIPDSWFDAWQDSVVTAARKFAPEKPLAGPLRVDLCFLFPRPESHFSGTHSYDLRPDAPRFHTAKPDRDNSAKAVTDALSQLGFWEDGSQICAGTLTKVYTAFTSGCWISIQPAGSRDIPEWAGGVSSVAAANSGANY